MAIYVVIVYILFQVFETCWVKIVCENAASFLSGRKSKWSNACEDVHNDIFFREYVYKASMFRVQP